VANQVYFASGAFNDRRNREGSKKEDCAQTPEQIRRFFDEGQKLFEHLCRLPLTHVAYHVLETLHFLIPLNPSRVFQLVHQCVMAAQSDSIQRESMAVNEVVTITQRYLADHRDLFREDPDLRANLMDVLDIFVEAGWPQAVRLA